MFRESLGLMLPRKRLTSSWPTTISRASWRQWCGVVTSTTVSPSSSSFNWLSTAWQSSWHSSALVPSRSAVLFGVGL